MKYEDPDEEAGLQGQQQILRELGDRLMENMADALKVGWIGPRAPAGTRLNAIEARRTHAYVVPKGAVDRLLQPQFESMLADKDPEVNKVGSLDAFGIALYMAQHRFREFSFALSPSHCCSLSANDKGGKGPHIRL